MATSSRQSAIFGVQDWKAIYQTYSQADFKSYDYETLRKSFIDYLTTYYPETYNDYIESSEFIALLDVIAFMGQGLAFRNDLNARENFIDTAERRDSVIKLANLVSYTPKRNLEAEGYIKVTSIQTTQNIQDINGFNLSNTPIFWNDPANPNWLEQFNTIINATLINSQRIGNPGNTATILGVLTQEYGMNIPSNALPIVPFNATIAGTNTNFELTSMTSVGSDSLYEIPPAPSGVFNMLYRNDQLGYGSPNTGFFCYFKQGSLQNYDFSLDQQISNQVVDIDIQGINNTDTWLYQLNDNNSSTPVTLWQLVENVYADAYLQAETSNRTIFSVTSRFNDQVSYVFGDGVFSQIPVGNFRAYVRAGNALTYVIQPTEMQGLNVSFTYVDRYGNNQTLTLGLNLQTSVSTAQARESLASIKQNAPSRYYTQNRMVNGEDYSNFPYTLYSSIMKSTAINRSSVGVSKNFDLLDPTGKYSSTDCFASDGAMYQDSTNGFDLLTITSNTDIISFLNNTLAEQLADNRAIQYYIQNYPRYTVNSASGDGTVYWNLSTVDANSNTGYFYNLQGQVQLPIPTGTYNTHNVMYVTQGAMLQFIAPSGYYFDSNNRLTPGIPGPSNTTFIWTTVLNVIGDGYNNGVGQFSNGNGPVTLNNFIPQGAILNTIIPSFDNNLPSDVIQEAITRMGLNENFSLIFNNSLSIAQERWSIDIYNTNNWFVNFQCTGTNQYTITYQSIAYYFGSVADTRFTFNGDRLIYDPYSGKSIQDYVSVLATNTQYNSNYPLAAPVQVYVVGQTIESDGYVDDFSIEVSSIDVNNNTVIANPDFFQTVTGYQASASNIGIYAFFELVQDAINLSRMQLIDSSTVVYGVNFPNLSVIETVKYQYPMGQLFYAYAEDTFYTTMQDNTVTTLSYIVYEPMIGTLPQYYMQPGRQGLQFQYRHNSDDTTRIDPVVTNIIDLYVVPQAYYTAYQSYIQDTTNTIPIPDQPTISELSTEYDQIQNYKMLTDAVIVNSVSFKPLFGPKAAPNLRGTIKVIPNASTNASNNEIVSAVLSAMNSYFDINNWNFGDTFYFSELSAYIHSNLGDYVSSTVLVPNDPTMQFGDLYEIRSMPYEIFVNAATANDIQVIAALTPATLQIGQ
jgi:hypothetical protein